MVAEAVMSTIVRLRLGGVTSATLSSGTCCVTSEGCAKSMGCGRDLGFGGVDGGGMAGGAPGAGPGAGLAAQMSTGGAWLTEAWPRS